MSEIELAAGLEDYATPTQKRYLEAVQKFGGVRAAARELGVDHGAISHSLKRLREHASREGFAPGHWQHGVAPGYLMGKVTVQRDAGGEVERTWERQSPDQQRFIQAIQAAAEAMAEDLPRVLPILKPLIGVQAKKRLNLYTITDAHVGMLAWHREGGADWDLHIADTVLGKAFRQMIDSSPPAAVGFINQLGDFLHTDGLVPMTPTSHNILDADGRFEKMVRNAIRLIRYMVDTALVKHEKVILLLAEGNHDMASSIWLRHMFGALYENEPRVEVISSALPYYAHQHGQTMLAFHHGHLKKPDAITGVMAAGFPEMWGATKYRYAHMGHQHHLHIKEDLGMIVTQHQTLAARDAYAARGGWFAERAARAITYHTEYGQVGEVVVRPEMEE